MNTLNISTIGAALALAFSTGAMAAPTMSKADYSAARDGISAEYKSARAACNSQTANAKDICIAEARGSEKVAAAELEARNTPTSKTRHAVLVAKADANYAVAKERCDDRTGNDKTVCVKEAKAAYASAKANQPASHASTAPASKKESAGVYVDDSVITAKVKAAVLEDASLKSAEINVETSKGRVQLSGFVRSNADISRAVEVARGVKGVKSVKNDMILKGTQ